MGDELRDDLFCGACDDTGRIVCHRCDGSGFVLTCIDDMCRGAGECMHGDGESICPECHGDGEFDCMCVRHPLEGKE